MEQAVVRVSEWVRGDRGQYYSFWEADNEVFVAEYDEVLGFEVGGIEDKSEYLEGVVYDWAYLEAVNNVDDFDEEYADRKVREFLA